MNRLRTAICAAGAATGIACASPVWSYFGGGDAGYEALSGNTSLESGTVEGRIGNRLDIGTFELAIWRRHDVGPLLAQGQLAWQNGVGAPFSIAYDGNHSVTYTLGGVTIASADIAGPFSDIFIRTRSATFGTVSLSSMRLVAPALSIGDLSSVGNATVNYIRLSNQGSPFSAFELRGTETLNWLASDPPVNSQVSAQFRFTNVPAPAASLLLTPLALMRRRRR